MPMDGPALTARIPTPPWGDFADRHLVGIDEYVRTGDGECSRAPAG